MIKQFDGWISIDKPCGVTSRKTLNDFNRIFGVKKAGYAGTLDPFASGVLPLAVGKATKTLEYFMEIDKEYCFTIKFGLHTDSLDITGNILETRETNITRNHLEAILDEFTGIIDQTPPKFSAIKINGRRAYDMARNNEEFEVKSRKVEIFEINLVDFDYQKQEANIWVRCGKGTYIRSLSVQIAERLGTIATTIALHRKRFGVFNENNTFSLEKLSFLLHNANLEGCIFPVDYVLDDIPAMQISELEAKKLLYGQSLERSSDSDLPKVRLLCSERIIAIGELYSNKIKPLKILEN